MENNRNTRKSNKAIFITFIVVFLVLYAAGYFAGRMAAGVEGTDSFEQVTQTVKEFLINVLPIAFLAVSVLAIVIPTITFLSCNSMYKKLQNDRDNDDLWDSLEDRLNVPMILSNAFSIIDTCLFFCFLYVSLVMDYGKNGGYQTVIIIAGFLLFVIAAILEIVIPKLTLDIEKKLNPEKQGNILDFNFQRVWMNSCDEAEKLTAYKAGYQAFLSTNITCIILCMVAFVVTFIFKTDILAPVFVCIIWFANNLSYMLRATKLEKRK